MIRAHEAIDGGIGVLGWWMPDTGRVRKRAGSTLSIAGGGWRRQTSAPARQILIRGPLGGSTMGGRKMGFRWLSMVAMAAFGLLVLPPTVATAAVGEGCPNESLRSELNSGVLAECRAYEMVTPVYKEGYPVLTATGASFAGSGEQVILESAGEFAGNPGGAIASVEGQFLYLDRRTSGGWRLSPLNPPDARFSGQIVLGVEAQSGETLWVLHTPEQSFSTRDLYIRSVNGEYSLVGPFAPAVEGEEGPSNLMHLEDEPFVAATTSDYGHILLYASNDVAEGWPSFDPTMSGGSLYEYSGTGRSQPILVGVTGTEKGSENLVGTCGIEPGSGGEFTQRSMYNALSASGEAVFFTVEPCGGTGEVAEVYERLRGALTSPGAAETVDVSASECTSACGGVSGKEFEGASEDGERVYFTSTQKLTDGAVDGTASGNATSRHFSGEGASCATIVPGAGGCNLYEYDAGAPVGERLVLVAGGEVQGVVGIAEDGARVYYVSREEVPGAGVNELGKGPVAGGDNLYVYDALDGRTAFVATLSNEPEEPGLGGEPALWSKRFESRPAQVAGSGGQFLLFASDTPQLTPDDTSEVEQLFEYDAETGELVRVTQGENGYNENGNGVLAGIEPEGAITVHNLFVGSYNFHSGTNLLNISGDGRTVAFETTGRLSERATAAEQGCTSVYVFHTGGRLSEGSVHLISDGKDAQFNKGSCGAQFAEMDEDGANILFFTDDSLLAGDTDGGQRDIYDARVDGGFPPGTASSSCEEHGCEGSTNGSVSAPVLGAPDSTTGTGTGNLPPGPVTSSQVKHAATKKRVVCGRHKRRVHGRCLAPRAKSKQARSRKAHGKRRHKS